MVDLVNPRPGEDKERQASRIKLPTFLVIGAMRAGTTTLYHELRGHPDVFMAPIKETNFFAIHDGKTDLPLTDASANNLIASSVADAADYRRLFEGAASALAVGEVSPSYLYSPMAAGRIKSSLATVRIIALLRDPVDRAYSAYLRRAGAVDDPEAFLSVAEAEQRTLDSNGPLPLYPLLLGGLYGHHLTPYVRSFPKSQLWLRLYEEFWASPEQSLPELHAFLGVEPNAPIGDLRLNRSGVPRYPRLDRMIRAGSSYKTYAKRYLPPKVVRSLVNAKQKAENWTMERPAQLPREIRQHLIQRYFEADFRRLEAILDRNLDAWRQV